MSSNNSNVDNFMPKKMKIELNDDDFEFQPVAKRVKIDNGSEIVEIKGEISQIKDEIEAVIDIEQNSQIKEEDVNSVEEVGLTITSDKPISAKRLNVKVTINVKKSKKTTKTQQNQAIVYKSQETESNGLRRTTRSSGRLAIKSELMNHSAPSHPESIKPEIIDISQQAVQQFKAEPESIDIIDLSSDVIDVRIPKNEPLDTSCEIIEVPIKEQLIKMSPKKEVLEFIKISPKSLKVPKKEEPVNIKLSPKLPKKEDPDQENRPFGMLPISHINDLFDDLPGSSPDHNSTIVITDDIDDPADEVDDDDDCIIVTFKCDLCPKALKSEQSLKDHKKLHNFQCTICNKRFVKDRHLRRHKRDSHDNPKRFSCQICGKKFNRLMSVLNHKIDIHDVRPKAHKCATCGYECDSEKGFKKHEKKHKTTKDDKKAKIEVNDEKKVFTFTAVKNTVTAVKQIKIKNLKLKI